MRYLPYLFAIMLVLPVACLKHSSQPIEDALRYNYPNYNDGHIGFYHTFYMDCGDSEYWRTVFRSKEFFAEGSLFLILSEEIGFKQEIPNITLKEEVTLVCSNGDLEVVLSNFPYPQCIDHIQDVLLLFSGVPSTKQNVVKYNGFIDVQQDTVQVIAHYKSYWTGNIVNDTAYVSP